MKKILVLLIIFFGSVPVWADGNLTAEPVEQAIKEYEGFLAADNVDPMSHVVWKLYVYSTVTPKNGINRPPEYLLAGLTPRKKDHLFVHLSINQLYNFLKPIAKPGDVVVVEGRIRKIVRSRKDPALARLNIDAENAVSLPQEHF